MRKGGHGEDRFKSQSNIFRKVHSNKLCKLTISTDPKSKRLFCVVRKFCFIFIGKFRCICVKKFCCIFVEKIFCIIEFLAFQKYGNCKICRKRDTARRQKNELRTQCTGNKCVCVQDIRKRNRPGMEYMTIHRR